MTPLAHRIVKDLTLPQKDRSESDHAGLLQSMDDVHCFDISEIFHAALDAGGATVRSGCLIEAQAFLPAPKTWIELKLGALRTGYLLQMRNETEASAIVAFERSTGWSSWPDPVILRLDWTASDPIPPVTFNPGIEGSILMNMPPFTSKEVFWEIGRVLLGALACINTPRIIGRRTHLPHRGLERELLKRKAVIGKFPLHAWTEILLDVTPPEEAKGLPDYEARLTGEKALHFVRAHLRIRLGKLEFVSSHWRGSVTNGIKRSRYIMTDKKRSPRNRRGAPHGKPAAVKEMHQ